MEYNLILTEKQMLLIKDALEVINKQIDIAKQLDIEIKENEANRNK